MRNNRGGALLTVLFAGGTVASVIAPMAQALEYESGNVQATFDTTFTFGARWRVQGRDADIIGQSNGGRNGLATSTTGLTGVRFGDGSSNVDNGNLNYDTGLVNLSVKGVHELALDWQNWGLFVRGLYFYDRESQEGDRARRATNVANVSFANPVRGAEVQGLNAALSALIGSGVINTSTLANNNQTEGTRARLGDGARDAVGADQELLDAYVTYQGDFGDVPVDIRIGQQVVSWGESTFIGNGINVINPIDVPAARIPGAEVRDLLLPVNMLYGSAILSDTLSVEAFYQFEWEAIQPDEPGTYFSTSDSIGEDAQVVSISGLDECFDTISSCVYPNSVQRAADNTPSDSGQWGLAARLFAPNLNSTEFGVFALNYHSRRPLISVTAGNYEDSVYQSTFLGVVSNAAFVSAVGGATNAIQPAWVAAQHNARLPGSGDYFLEYPEDIKLYGLSFNTFYTPLDIAFSGELSYRPDYPIQIDDQELIQAMLSTGDDLAAASVGAIGLDPATEAFVLSQLQQGPRSQYNSFVTTPGEGERIIGYINKEVIQTQVTFVRSFGPQLGASQVTAVGEIGMTHVNLPEPAELAIETGGVPDDGGDRGQQDFADDFSMGYRLRMQATYNNFFRGWNLTNTYSFSHDTNGNTPLPIGNFLEDRRSFGATFGLNYRQLYNAELNYTTFFGAGQRNLINDRDFVALTFQAFL